jgi:hypothetical protein
VANMRRPGTIGRWWIQAAGLLAVLGIAACDSEYPEDTGGGTISGVLYYEGDGLEGLQEPALVVAAFGDDPTKKGIPHATNMFIRPVFKVRGIPYLMTGLTPWNKPDGTPGGYTVLATLIDLTSTDPNTIPQTLGYYPNFCNPVKIEVLADAPVKDIDVTLYDSMGFQDPCMTGGF